MKTLGVSRLYKFPHVHENNITRLIYCAVAFNQVSVPHYVRQGPVILHMPIPTHFTYMTVHLKNNTRNAHDQRFGELL